MSETRTQIPVLQRLTVFYISSDNVEKSLDPCNVSFSLQVCRSAAISCTRLLPVHSPKLTVIERALTDVLFIRPVTAFTASGETSIAGQMLDECISSNYQHHCRLNAKPRGKHEISGKMLKNELCSHV